MSSPCVCAFKSRSGSLERRRRNITIVFNENVQLEDAFNKVVISPVQLEAPQISANGRNVRVQIRDTMKANTTYTIDFADAIKDLNEGNVLDGFALDFSTGESIDTMRVSGMVLELQISNPPRACSLQRIQTFQIPPYALCHPTALPVPTSTACLPFATSPRYLPRVHAQRYQPRLALGPL